MPADAAALSWSEPVNDSQTSLTGSGVSSEERSMNDAGSSALAGALTTRMLPTSASSTMRSLVRVIPNLPLRSLLPPVEARERARLRFPWPTERIAVPSGGPTRNR